jgi:putative DNA primase/helicase
MSAPASHRNAQGGYPNSLHPHTVGNHALLERILDETQANPVGNDRWLARCPAHDDRTHSLSITVRDGRLLLYCFAGCNVDDVCAALGIRLSDLFTPNQQAGQPLTPPTRPSERQSSLPSTDDLNAWESEWQRARAEHPLLRRYFIARGLAITPPPTLRIGYHHNAPYLLARIESVTGDLRGLHRTHLAPDGSRRLERRMAKGSRVLGSTIRLYPACERLAVAEGIETALAVNQMTGWPVWATISASGMAALEVPNTVGAVLICADHDDTGIKAAKTLAQRLAGDRRSVSLSISPRKGSDWLDVLTEVTA